MRPPVQKAVMMHVSTRFLSLFGLPLIAVFAVSCAQSGGELPTSPSSRSVGPSATAVGPSASYDATGTWRFVTTLGNDTDTFTTDVTQLANGNLQFLDDDNQLITLERLSQGAGAVITYRLSNIGSDGGDCDLRSHGTVRLDTRTNTITARIRLKELGCSNERAGVFVTGTKLN